MNQTELNKYQAMLEARQAELSAGLRNREDIAIEKTPGMEILEPTVFTGDHGLTLHERAPFGVLLAITPSTNPTENQVLISQETASPWGRSPSSHSSELITPLLFSITCHASTRSRKLVKNGASSTSSST